MYSDFVENFSISPFLSNIFLCFLERDLSGNQLFPRVYHRYVDDIFAVVKKRNLAKTLKLFNETQHHSIKFTVEEEVDGSLNFLELTIKRDEDGRLNFKVFRKPTWTGRTITNSSFHSKQHKAAAYHSFANRLVSVPMGNMEFQADFKKIIDIGIQNGFAATTTKHILNKQIRRKRLRDATALIPLSQQLDVNDTEAPKTRRSVPFCGKWMNTFQRLCGAHNIEAVSNSTQFKTKRILKSA